MFPPLPIPPVVTNAKGERVANPMLRSVRGITLQPKLLQRVVTVPAATGVQPGTASPITFESPFAGYTEIFNFMGGNVTGKLELFVNVNCTRYGSRYFTSRPTPYPFVFCQAGNTLTTSDTGFLFNPGLNEIAVAPMIAPQQTVSVEMYNLSNATIDVATTVEGRLIERQVNEQSGGKLFDEYNRRGAIQPYWLAPEQNIIIGNLNTNLPGIVFQTAGDRVQTMFFVNKYPNTFIATGCMIQVKSLNGSNLAANYNVRMFNNAYHDLTNAFVPVNQYASTMTQPYFFPHPVIMNRGEIFRMDFAADSGYAIVSNTIVYATLFGMSLI